jgi:hypothetical protein
MYFSFIYIISDDKAILLFSYKQYGVVIEM